MNDTVRRLQQVETIDTASMIADGLETIARDIRQGKLPFTPLRCLVMLSARGAGHDQVAALYFGADASLAETVGLCELAKAQLLESE